MWRTTQRFLILFAALTLTGCASYQVREPAFQLPPLPEAVLQPCQEPDPLPDREMSMAELYLLNLRDQAPWAECRRRQAQLAALVRYQAEVRAALDQSLKQSSKPWWQLW